MCQSIRIAVCEPLENRTLLAGVSFAVIGDFGQAGKAELDVANRVKSWNPAFVLTVGDNNYSAAAGSYDANVGQYYHDYIYPYRGTRGTGPADNKNRFFPALGNHDWDIGGGRPYLDYFTLPGNERYYTVTQGPVQIFVLDSDPREPALGYVNAGTSTQNSTMGQWLKGALAASTTPWQIVVVHHAPFSSGGHGSSAWMQYPYQQWGADAVLTGHDHHYERIVKSGLPYFVNGTGGAGLRNSFRSPAEPGSASRYASDYGAMKVDATDTSLAFRFITRGGATIDTYTLSKSTTPPPPPTTPAAGIPKAPTALTARVASSSAIDLAWSDNATNETGYQIERSTDGQTFYRLAGTGANGRAYRNTGLTPGKRYYYRVYAINPAGRSAFSNVATAVIPQTAAAAAPAATTFSLQRAKPDTPAVWA